MLTRAFVIKSRPTNEFDRQIICHTENLGKLTAIAKSCQRPTSIQGMHLADFNLVEFELISGRGMPIISSAQAQKTYPHIKSSLRASAVAYFLMEVLDKTSYDNQKDSSLWNFIKDAFDWLDKEQEPTLKQFRQLQSRFIKVLGYAPNFGECGICSEIRSASWALSVDFGGIICGKCFLSGGRGIILRPTDLNLLSQESGSASIHNSVLDNILESIANSTLSSLNMLNTVIK